MEFVAGESLADTVARGPMSEKEIARLGVQMGSALDEAHEHRIIHRDLKPANVRLTAKGQVKVLDFGIALLSRPAEGETTTQSATESNVLAGTLAYMSPEQVRGEAVDARSDLYSFGVLLYEMATGLRPFHGKTSLALANAIVNDIPSPPRTANPRLTPGLEQIILKCLEKDPENRYQSAKEVGVDLRRLGTGTAQVPVLRPSPWWSRGWSLWIGSAVGLLAIAAITLALNVGHLRDRLAGRGDAPAIHALAVLPLENLSHDAGQDYLVVGMHAELITTLGKLAAVRVTARSSVMPYKQTSRTAQEIGRDLGVEAIVEGSVLQAGTQVRISVELVDVNTGEVRWRDSYQRELRDVLTLQAKVAQDIAREIGAAITPQGQALVGRSRPLNPEAHAAYLQARFLSEKQTLDYSKKAREKYEEARKIDPEYAPVYAGLSDVEWNIASMSSGKDRQEGLNQARLLALKAVGLDPSLSHAHTALGWVHMSDWHWLDAEREFKLAINQNPSEAYAHQGYAQFLFAMGKREEGLEEDKIALLLDPISPLVSSAYGFDLYHSRKYDDAIVRLGKASSLDPGLPFPYWSLSMVAIAQGDFAQAVKFQTRAAELSNNDPTTAQFLAVAHAAAGNRRKALGILEQWKDAPGILMTRALTYAWLEDKDQAFKWLDQAVRDRSAWRELKGLPIFDPLRDDPRFGEILRRMGLPE
jgi:TolB-like protein/Tfp pilus assembly protein PilF